MTRTRLALIIALPSLIAALGARPVHAEEAAAQLAVAPRAERPARGMHKIAFGVLVGETRFSLDATAASSRGVPMDSWTDRGLQVVPTFCVGGDGYFMKLDFPIAKTSTASSYGLGLYPLNYGHLFQKLGLFPYVTAGVSASVLTLPGQGISGAIGVARLATGFRLRVAGGLAFAAEIGYSPFAVAGLVDKRQTHDLVQSAIDGNSVDLSAGMRPARGGLGRELDVLVGLVWM